MCPSGVSGTPSPPAARPRTRRGRGCRSPRARTGTGAREYGTLRGARNGWSRTRPNWRGLMQSSLRHRRAVDTMRAEGRGTAANMCQFTTRGGITGCKYVSRLPLGQRRSSCLPHVAADAATPAPATRRHIRQRRPPAMPPTTPAPRSGGHDRRSARRPTAAASAPSQPRSATTPASAPPGTPAPGTWKVGVVTDVGTLDDKNFNQYSFEGAEAGAPPSVPARRPRSSRRTRPSTQRHPEVRRPGLQHHRHGRLQPRRRHDEGRQEEPELVVRRRRPVADLRRRERRSRHDLRLQGRCQDPAAEVHLPAVRRGSGRLPRRDRRGQHQQGGQDRRHRWHQLGPAGRPLHPGLPLGAQSVNPNIVVKTAYVSTSDFGKAFNDPKTGTAFATQFIKANGVDVLFQVAGKTGNGVLHAACKANIMAIGVDVDQFLSYPAARRVHLTSAEKHLSVAVAAAITAIAGGTATPGDNCTNAANNGIGASPTATTRRGRPTIRASSTPPSRR